MTEGLRVHYQAVSNQQFLISLLGEDATKICENTFHPLISIHIDSHRGPILVYTVTSAKYSKVGVAMMRAMVHDDELKCERRGMTT